jgi:NAD(P)-dependent dehydrogenase (short-subunit alcohol dehydrogenase family)
MTTATGSARVWFITGASSGLGRALTEAVLARDDRVGASVRDLDALAPLATRYGDRLLGLVADVTDHEAVTRAVDATVSGLGRLDVVVNNAGYALGGAVEELSEQEWQAQLSVNLLGAAAVLRAALPHLRRAGSGHVINISSLSGLVGMAGSGAYNASKFAIEGLSEALAEEVGPLGIRVTAVEPGNLRTDFAGRSAAWTAQHISDYDDTAGALRTGLAGMNGQQPGDPARAAAAIITAVHDPHPPRHLLLGADAIETAERSLTERLDELARWRDTAIGIAHQSTDTTP